MRRLTLVLGFLLGAAALRASSVPVLPGEDVAAFQGITVGTTTAVALTSTNYVLRGGFGASHGGTQSIFCTVDTDSIRFEVDGSSPTATAGHHVASGDSFQIDGYAASRNLIMIGDGTVAAKAQCTFFTGE